MPYAQVDDNMTEHPKIERLSDRAFRAYVTSICFCSRNLTDGMILAHQALKVGAVPKVVRELVDGHCWDECADGFRVHDYLEWNKSRADVEAFRARQRAAGLASGAARGSTNGTASGENQRLNPPKPNPLPINLSKANDLPPNPPKRGEPAERAKKGSKRKRDVIAYEAERAQMTPEERYLGKAGAERAAAFKARPA